jgi:DNA polymerase alpha subunit A
VNEDDYNTIVEKRVQEFDDFVVDDDGQGYAETGLEIWDQPREESSGEDEYDEYMTDSSKKVFFFVTL